MGGNPPNANIDSPVLVLHSKCLHISTTREELNVGKLWPESFPPNSIFCVISVTAFKKVKGQSRNPQLFSHRLTLFPPLLRPLATTIAVGCPCTTAAF